MLINLFHMHLQELNFPNLFTLLQDKMYQLALMLLSIVKKIQGTNYELYSTDCVVKNGVTLETNVRSGLECAAHCTKESKCLFYSHNINNCLLHTYGTSTNCATDLVRPGWKTIKKKGSSHHCILLKYLFLYFL